MHFNCFFCFLFTPPIFFYPRKLWANLFTATLGVNMCRPVGPVSLPSWADEPVSSCQRPNWSCGTERGSTLHWGRDEQDRGQKEKMNIISQSVNVDLVWLTHWACASVVGVWVWHSSTFLWPPVQSSYHSYHPGQVSSYIILVFYFFTLVTLCGLCGSDSSLAFSLIWQSDR